LFQRLLMRNGKAMVFSFRVSIGVVE